MISIGVMASHDYQGMFMLRDQKDHGIVYVAAVLSIDNLLIISNQCFTKQIKVEMSEWSGFLILKVCPSISAEHQIQ